MRRAPLFVVGLGLPFIGAAALYGSGCYVACERDLTCPKSDPLGAGGGGGAGGASSSGSSSGSSSASSGGSGCWASGPDQPCVPSDPSCPAVPSCCVALHKNSSMSSVRRFRVAQMTFTNPTVFAQGAFAASLAEAFQLDLPACNLYGTGLLSLLFELDAGSMTFKAGAAEPSADPSAGFCFINAPDLGGFSVQPATAPLQLVGGTYTQTVDPIVLPFFVDAAKSGQTIVPLNKAHIAFELSSDGDCIGAFNADVLDPSASCKPDPPKTLAFTEPGTLTGHITLEAADKVVVGSTDKTLCVLLSGSALDFGDGGHPAKCKRDPVTQQIVFQGDWCAAADKADPSCRDAMHVTATFAASATEIVGTCK